MSLKTLLVGSVVTLGLLFGGALWLSRPAPQSEVVVSADDTGKLTADQTFYDFGTVSMARGKVVKKFTLTNSDQVPAVVTKMFTSCMCTEAKLTVAGQSFGPYGMPGHGATPLIAASVPASATAEVEVIFDPAAHGPAGVGQIERVVTVEHNGQPPLLLTIRANVTP